MALKSAILINGGASIALMTFVGNLRPSERHFIVYGLFVFAMGVLSGGAATFFAYLAQNKFMEQINANKESTDNQWQKVSAIWVCGFSYLAFFSGSILAGLGILGCGI
ncbi:MAG: hypothetical protein AB7Q01_05580 [Gammaproteobacteria bacterium]